MTVRFRAGAVFGGGDGKRAVDPAVVADDIKALGGHGDAEVHGVSLRGS